MDIITTKDTEHTGHDVDHVETIWDNPAEMTEWMYCRDCEESYIGYGTELDY